MREIKFRGKRVDNGEWVYGSLYYEEVECEKQVFHDGLQEYEPPTQTEQLGPE